ncbi:CBO0543 family protein [Neobacillus soli]|uniref:CBO0543 family protein n=1 Tax=Neobacillus soli TaxID=220688 RepID=UPI000825FA70|nr:CBO0543 family protein [Neobacillus soli]
MKVDWIILIFVWILTFALIFIIPRNKRRLAIVAFLFKQVITWIVGLVVVQYHLLSYPVRLFSTVNRSSFTYEYFVYPVICAIFNSFYPNLRKPMFKFFYYFAFCTILTIPEVILEKKTDLIHYIHWTWYWTWITLLITFVMTRYFCVWFFNGFSKDMN